MKLGSILVSLVVVKNLIKSIKSKSNSFCCAFFTRNNGVKEATLWLLS